MPESAFGAHDASVKLGGPPADRLAEAIHFVDRCNLSVEKQRARLADAEQELKAAQAVLDSIQGA